MTQIIKWFLIQMVTNTNETDHQLVWLGVVDTQGAAIGVNECAVQILLGFYGISLFDELDHALDSCAVRYLKLNVPFEICFSTSFLISHASNTVWTYRVS